jgi:hypothetical protein
MVTAYISFKSELVSVAVQEFAEAIDITQSSNILVDVEVSAV